MAILDAVRKAALPAIWSQGVKLARERAVSSGPSGKSERTFRVRAPGHAVAPTVTLYFDDDEWSCDCGGKVDPCAHVAAAAIAAQQVGDADSAGDERDRSTNTTADERSPAQASPPAQPGVLAPSAVGIGARAAARIVYKLGVRERRLTLARFVTYPDGRQERLTTPLATGTARRNLPAGLEPTHDDLRIDRTLGPAMREQIPVDRVAHVLLALASGEAVEFEGQAVRVSADPLVPRVVVEDAPSGGFVLRVEADPSLEKVVAMGVARAAGVLRPLGETQTTGEWLERLPYERRYSREQSGELVTKVLPELEKRLPVTVNTRKLPTRAVDARPRIAFDLTPHGHTLSVLPLLVYGDPPVARVDGDTLVVLGKRAPVRQPALERDLVHKLRDELNLVPGRRVDFDGLEAGRFGARLRSWQLGEAGALESSFARAPLVAALVLEGDRFDLSFESVSEEGRRERASTEMVLRAWRDGLELVPLENGGWAPLPADWLSKHGHRVADLLAARDEQGQVPRAVVGDLAALCRELDAPPPPAFEALAPLLDGFSRIPRAVLPADLQASLRPYQEVGVDWLSFLRDAELGGILADDMGLGKTLQTIASLRGRVLVVCPKSVVHNWAHEIARFRPTLKTAVYHGTERALDPGADVTLTTYAVLRLDTERLAEPSWDAIVLDEAQAIKNETSQTARAAFALRGRFRLALSGTPVENRLEELWSLMRFSNPGLLGGRADFQDRYSAPIATGDAGAGERLRAKIRPFVLRRMKRDVLGELPPRTDSVLHVELDEGERAVYDTVRAATKRDLVARLAEGSGVLAALEALLRLRQAACHSGLVPGQEASSSSKVERLLEALEEAAADGHRALVFSQWTGLLDRVEPHLRAADLRFCRLDGSTRDRESVVGEFQDPAGPPVMLVSLKAGGTGLNLTAADHVFLLDPWWNPAVEDQAADRAHRIGQDRPVMVYRMVAKDTVEEGIFALQEKKRAIAEVALGSADHAGGITREELLALLD